MAEVGDDTSTDPSLLGCHLQTERWQSWWATVVLFLLTFVLSYERMKLKMREGLIILLMLPRAECESAVGRDLSPLKTNEKRPQVLASV